MMRQIRVDESPAAGEMVQMMAVLELPPRLACSMRVSLLSLKGTWLLPCTMSCYVMLITRSDLKKGRAKTVNISTESCFQDTMLCRPTSGTGCSVIRAFAAFVVCSFHHSFINSKSH